MYVVKIFRDGEWQSWGSAASPRIINKYLELLRMLHPTAPVMVDQA